MAFAPISYGPEVAPDDQGVNAMQRATAQHEQVFAEAKQLGNVVEGGAQAITQGILHTQALKATAAVKERQASTLQFIDSNPYVPKAVLQQRMTPEDYQAWHAGLATEYQDKDAVPMFTAAGALFDSEAQQARQAAGDIISLPGWRGAWAATEQSESATIRERYVNRLAADQMISDQRAQTLLSLDKTVDSATKPEDIDAAIKGAETSPWLKPAERKYTMEKYGVAKDSFAAENFMRAQDLHGMEDELVKLRSDNAADLYPHMNEKQRLDLANRLEREASFKGASQVAEKVIVGPNIDADSGRVNSTAIAKAVRDYNGPNKPEVMKAVKQQEAEAQDQFNKSMAELSSKIISAGTNPLTFEFSMHRAMQDPDARKAAFDLDKNGSPYMNALRNADTRAQRFEFTQEEERRTMKRQQKADVDEANLRGLFEAMEVKGGSEQYLGQSAEQFDQELLVRGIDPGSKYFNAGRAYFAQYKKRGGPDERPARIVNAELSMAGAGDRPTIQKLTAKYGDDLLAMTHDFIRTNSDMPADKLTDAARQFVKTQLGTGTVVGSSKWTSDDRAREIDWLTNPNFRGKDFKAPDGTIIPASKQVVRLSRNGETRIFTLDAADAAQQDGWK